MNILIFPEIKTQRLTLRQIKDSDSDSILFLRTDKVVNEFIYRPKNRQTNTIDEVRKHIKKINTETKNNKSITWGITLSDTPKIIGTICLWNFSANYTIVEVGYDLDPKFQKKGIMSEALNSIVNYAFNELNVINVEAYTHFKNENSKKLLLKNGFSLTTNKVDPDNLSNQIYNISKPS